MAKIVDPLLIYWLVGCTLIVIFLRGVATHSEPHLIIQNTNGHECIIFTFTRIIIKIKKKIIKGLYA